MPRKQQRKTDTGTISADVMERAVKQVVEDKHSIRKVCKDTSIAKTTLIRYINKYKNAKEGSQNEVKFMPNYACRRIFSDTEEKMLEEYIVEASRIHYGLTLKMVRRLAYEFGLANSRKMPDSWLENEMAGEDWLGSFRKRHQHLSLRQPEATSLSRATSFNHHNVSSFFKNLKYIYDRFKLGPGDIYNVDETGLTTCHNPGKIMAQKGIKQIGKVSSADRGQLVTVCACINALGNSIPPFFIFPRVKFKEYMLHGAPTGSAGCAHSSGWMTSENFIIFLEHFIKYAKCSKQAPILLLLDNHESHVSIPALNLAKNNGIHMLTFPPHTSHKMQPLDRTVFGPLKSYYNKACDSRMMTCPGKPLTIYDISSLAGIAFPKAMTQKNIQSGFKVTGIWPYNEDIFQDHEFKSSYVTDQPTPVMTDLSTPSCSNNQHQNELDLNTTLIRIPEEVCPFPKAGLRKSTSGRRKCSSRILTDTPVKMILEEEARQKAIKKAIREANALKKTKKKLKVCFENSSDSDPDEIVDCEEKESSESENYSDHDLTTSEYDTSIKQVAFPSGGFSHSMGTEAAVQHHLIKDKGDIKVFIISCLENAGSMSIPFVRASYESFQDIKKLIYLDSLLNASLLNHVAQRASKQQGKAFLTTSNQVFPYDEVKILTNNVEEGRISGHFAVAFPVVCASLKIPILTVGHMFLFNTLRTLIASAVRLGKIGAVQAQQYQFEIQNLLDDILKRSWHILPEDSYISFPLPETVQNLHDTMFSKLFYS